MPSKHLPVGSTREPIIRPVRLTELRPTQMTVGMREVEERRQHWRSLASGKKRDAFLQTHLIPVILGAEDRHYIVDHHHLVLALHREGLEEMYVTVMADLSGLDKKTFWFVLDQRNWMHPFDAKGERRSYEDIPKRVDRMQDDPFRALAGALRRRGGFAKDTTPYSEFLWANFLRNHLKPADVQKDFDRALAIALKLAKKKNADYLPGWCGPSSE
jgi:hypothetical protein